MGCGVSKDNREPTRVLLVGSSGCGKSTIIKQMMVRYKGGFGDEELEDVRNQVRTNTVQRLAVVLDSIRDELDSEYHHAMHIIVNSAQSEFEWNYQKAVDPGLIAAVKLALTIPKVQEKKLERYYEAPWDFYFFNEIDRIFATNYIPTIDDALACKRFTVGIHEHSFNVDGMPVSMIDVGGRRKERIMWSKGMEGANAVIFIASLTDYNRRMEDDASETYVKKNSLEESLTLFEDIFHTPKLQGTPCILLLNKVDLFAGMIKSDPLSGVFDDFDGPDDLDNSLKYVILKFIRRAEEKGVHKQLHIYPICGIDTTNFQCVFKSVMTNIA